MGSMDELAAVVADVEIAAGVVGVGDCSLSYEWDCDCSRLDRDGDALPDWRHFDSDCLIRWSNLCPSEVDPNGMMERRMERMRVIGRMEPSSTPKE